MRDHSHTQKFLKLKDGRDIPVLGLGTWENTKSEGYETLKRLIKEKVYVHIDTAQSYGNEEAIGKLLQELFKEKALERKDLFITTKLAMYSMENPEEAFMKSLKDLQLEYLDLYLIHWPIQIRQTENGAVQAHVPLHQLWAKLEKFVDKGLVKSIGVSNFNFQLLNDLLSYARIKPACNQIELHPYLVQPRLVEWLKEVGVTPVAYSPLTRGDHEGKEQVPLNDPVIKRIADRHKRTVGQIILAWHLAWGHVIIPKTTHYERGIENASIFDIKLTEEEVKEIDGLNRNFRTVDNKIWGKPPINRLPVWE
jgi:alcohol dehydrogenase (NADP+)